MIVKSRNGLKQAKRQNELKAYSFIILQIIGFLVFSIYPIFWVFRYGFYDYDGVTATFIGWDNFIRAFEDTQYWRSLINTFIIAYGKLLVEIPLAFMVALGLTSVYTKFKRFFMVGFYLPKITGIAVNCMIFTFMFATFNGPINNILMNVGIIDAPINWLGTVGGSFVVIMLRSVWVGFCVNTLYFMAGISGVPTDCVEAAKIDGAKAHHIFFKITIPMLAPVLKTIIMLAMVNGIKMYQDVMLLTNGGPGGKTNVVMLYIYQLFMQSSNGEPQLGYASALGIITTIIIAIITVIYFKLTKKADEVYE